MKRKTKREIKRMFKRVGFLYLLGFVKALGLTLLLFGYYSHRLLFMAVGFIILDLTRSYIRYTIKLFKSLFKKARKKK